MHERAWSLDRKAIQVAFRRLGDRLVRRGVVADIYVIGGAAMTLAYDARRSTRDIDAVFQPHGVVLEEAGLWEIDPATGWKSRAARLYGLVFSGLRASASAA